MISWPTADRLSCAPASRREAEQGERYVRRERDEICQANNRTLGIEMECGAGSGGFVDFYAATAVPQLRSVANLLNLSLTPIGDRPP